MTENHNPGKPNHRIRTRQVNHPPDWELLQTFLGLAYTIQQEKPKPLAQANAQKPNGPQPALARIATFAQNATDASGAAIALGDASRMVCVARSGASAPAVGAEFNASDGLSGECIRLAQPVICVNASADPRVNYQACRALNIASLLYLPLRSSQGSLMGVLGVFSPQTLHFSQRDISCLRPTERLVQEALGSSAENPDTATLGALLRQAGIEAPAKEEPNAQEIDSPPMPLRPVEALPQFPRRPAASALPEKMMEPPRATADSIFVGRVVDDSVAEPDERKTKPATNEEESEGRSRISVMLILLLLLLAVSAAYKYRRALQRPKPQAKASETRATSAAPLVAMAPAEPAALKLTDAVSIEPMENGALIRIELPKSIRYEGYQLEHPSRIYFDLHDVKLSDDKGSEFKNAEGLVAAVRLFTYANGVTRIVFDLRHPAGFTAKLEDYPARLTIELKRTGGTSEASETGPGTK